jgi:hypothetical protein
VDGWNGTVRGRRERSPLDWDGTDGLAFGGGKTKGRLGEGLQVRLFDVGERPWCVCACVFLLIKERGHHG